MIVNNRTPEASEVPEWTLIDTLDKVKWLVEQLHTDKFSCDTESIELPWYRNHILCMSFCWGYPGKSAVLPFYKHQDNSTVNNDIIHKWTSDHFRAVRESLRTVLENPDIEKVFHNYKYDANVILKWLDIKVKGFVRDTMIFHHLLNEEGSHKLEDLAIEEFRYGDYSKKIKAIVGTGKKLLKTYDYIPDTDLWPYAATDAEASYRLDDTYTRHLQAKAHLWKLYVEESEPLLKALVKSEWYGHKIDVPLIDVLKKEYTDRQETLLAEMKALTNPEFKPLSNPQLVKAFIDLGLEGKIKNFKAVSGYTADKKVLGEIQDEVPLANKVLEYRTNRKIISTYLENAKVDVDDDGRIRYSWMPLTMTARLSCRFFHQIPKVNPIRKKQGLPNIRDLFIAEPGYSLVCGDYKQIELYILGIESQDDEMLKIMRDPNGDLHAASTYEFIHKVWPEYTEEMAKGDKFNRAEVGKRINFGLAYGSKGFSLVETGKWRDDKGRDHPFTWEMLEEGLEAWKKRFKGIGKYLENVPALARNHGGIVLNCFGRERRLGSQLNLENKHKREKAEREAVNFPIQSAAAALTNRTIGIMDRVIDNFIVERKLREGDIRLVNTVHDSIAYEVKNQLVEWFKETLKTIGERPIPELGNQSFEMEIGSGATWSIAEED
jgi:DNA polymerase-1